MSKPQPVHAIFTPAVVQDLINRSGTPYLKARGIITRQGPFLNEIETERTVLAHGRNRDKLVAALQPGVPVELLGKHRQMKDAKGSAGCWFDAMDLVRIFKAPASTKTSAKTGAKTGVNDNICRGRRLSPHLRAGHWRRQRHGKGGALTKMIFIADVIIGSHRTKKGASSCNDVINF